ncbi:peroxidase N1-like isoform X2 [Benincasa hispida]|uniref:peroxidase N1-like isoform X2 n=1 Tax=Benincasa hispida TaxID=102211 RepID=UPI001902214E|nr:peroxidase N1-like isoform X2 [Benincasa hispida]
MQTSSQTTLSSRFSYSNLMAQVRYNPMSVMVVYMIVLFAFGSIVVHGQGTRIGFYSSTCPQAESIVASTVRSHFQSDPRIAPGLLRMHFHDCFVRGCDASVLLAGSNSERTAPPNLSLNGFEVIDDAKSQLEAACPGVVSCADILTLAARDSVVLTSGIRWAVPTGRRDGTVSIASEANNLPGFRDSIDQQKKAFSDKGLNTQDLVTLVGKRAHNWHNTMPIFQLQTRQLHRNWWSRSNHGPSLRDSDAGAVSSERRREPEGCAGHRQCQPVRHNVLLKLEERTWGFGV